MILENEIYLVDETARYFKINEDSVRKLIKEGKLKAFKFYYQVVRCSSKLKGGFL